MNPNHARSSTHQAYRPEIDGLRAIAVVAVIINHFSKSTLPSGYLGVDIFFVISGYVITRSLLHKQQAGLGSFLLRFYARRARRLIPALVAFTLISGVLICIVNPAPAASLRTGAAGLIGLSNIELFMQATDYFAPSTEMNIFTHTWSLGVEEQFYLFYPILFWFAARLKGDGGGYVINNLRPSLLIISVASLALFFYWWHHNPPAAYFLTFSRLWELSCGCLLATQRQNSVMTMKPGNSLTAALSLAGIATVMFAPQQFAPITTPAVVLATAALIYYARSADPAIQFLQSKPVVFIGLISYSLYLWHWAILCLSRWTIGIQWWTIPLQSALMFGLAYASYRFIESPIRHASSTGWQHADVVAITSGTLASVGSAALVLAGLPGLGPVLFRLASPGEAMNPLYISEPYVPKKPWINTKNCTNPTSVSLKDKIDQCSLKASADKPTLFFLGDSQSHHLKGMAGRLQEVHGLGSQLLSISSMPFPTGHFWLSGPSELQRSKQDAERQNKIAATSIERARPKDIIILSARYIAYFSDYKIPLSQRGMDMKKYDSSGKRISDSIALLQWGRQLRSFLDRAAKKDIHVVVIAPFPEFPYSGSRCISYASIVNPQVDCRQAKQGLSSRSQQFQTMMNQIVKQHNNLYLFDPVPHLCPDRDYCYAKDRFGRLLFYDATHLSVYGSSTLATAFFSFLQKNQLIDAAASKDEELTPRQTSGREIIRLDTKPSAARKSG